MEEILASIRRIIEENDNGRKPDDAETSRASMGFANDENMVIAVDTFRGELRTAPAEVAERAPAFADAQPRRPEAIERKAPVLAEVPPPAAPAPEIRQAAAPRLTVDMRQPSERAPFAQAEAAPQAAKPASVAELPAQPVVQERPAAPPRMVAEAQPAPQKVTAEAQPAPQKNESVQETPAMAASHMNPQSYAAAAAEPESAAPMPVKPATVSPAPSSAAPARLASAPEIAPSKTSLLSQIAERKVAAAFGELSEAFVARSNKTFDDMAQQMMGPMLQEWLDNNLPVIVERLVREEIERVARGI